MITINGWCTKANNVAEEHGWNKNEVPFPEFISLCHSELSEALEEFRNGRDNNEIYFSNGNVGGEQKPEGIPIELADLLIRVFHYAGKHNIDLEHALELKHLFNTKRPYRHGGKLI